METRNMVIHMECGCEASWVKSLEEVCPTQSVDKCVDLPTNPSSIWDVPNINWLISVLPVTKRNDWRSDPDIKSWEHTVKSLRDPLKKSCNIKGSLVFPPYRWTDREKSFSGSSNIQRG